MAKHVASCKFARTYVSRCGVYIRARVAKSWAWDTIYNESRKSARGSGKLLFLRALIDSYQKKKTTVTVGEDGAASGS